LNYRRAATELALPAGSAASGGTEQCSMAFGSAVGVMVVGQSPLYLPNCTLKSEHSSSDSAVSEDGFDRFQVAE